MHSSFDIDWQNKSIDAKILVALEKINEVFRVLLWNKIKDIILSAIQILIFILFHRKVQCKVSYLAKELNVTKPTVSERIKLLLNKNFIIRIKDENDKRSFILRLTAKEQYIAKEMAYFTTTIEKNIGTIAIKEKEQLFSILIKIIFKFNQEGIINVQRMCF